MRAIIREVHYRYEDLGHGEFQQLVQALLALERGRGLRAMPLGQADGGRDALDGVVVFQVKFTADKPADPVTWLLRALDGEARNIRALVQRGTREYVLITNVTGTGLRDRGTIDRLDSGLRERKAAWGLDDLTAWWRDDVDARFHNAPRETKLSFVRALPPDQALALTVLDGSNSAGRIDQTLRAYLADQYDADDRVRFEQVDLAGPSVDKLFVDVPVVCTSPGSAPERLIAALRGGDGAAEAGIPDRDRHPGEGGAALLLHSMWSGNALIVGGPGEGKTTLLQYVCQVHRARHLGHDEYLPALPAEHTTQVARIPFRIDLRLYADWPGVRPVTHRQPGGGRRPQKSTALELYLADHIQNHSGGRACTVDDLVKVIAERPVLLALDGLDEVADLAERQRVAKEIVAATTRLTATAVDLVVLVSTRPGATAPPAGLSERFPTLRLDRLTPHLRLQYLDRWATQAGLSPSETGELRESFVEKQELPHVRELAAKSCARPREHYQSPNCTGGSTRHNSTTSDPPMPLAKSPVGIGWAVTAGGAVAGAGSRSGFGKRPSTASAPLTPAPPGQVPGTAFSSLWKPPWGTAGCCVRPSWPFLAGSSLRRSRPTPLSTVVRAGRP